MHQRCGAVPSAAAAGPPPRATPDQAIASRAAGSTCAPHDRPPPGRRPPPPAACLPPAAPPPAAFPVLGKPLVKEDDFPDLAAAAKVKESKKEKKKKQVLSLNEFLKSDVGGGGPAPAFGARRGGGGGGDIDLSSLPTAPRPRAEGEEAPSRHLGGGFREYGGEAAGRGRAVPAASGGKAAGCMLHGVLLQRGSQKPCAAAVLTASCCPLLGHLLLALLPPPLAPPLPRWPLRAHGARCCHAIDAPLCNPTLFLLPQAVAAVAATATMSGGRGGVRMRRTWAPPAQR